MALIHEEVIVIKLSKLIKGTEGTVAPTIADAEMSTALEQVVQELVGDSVIVEVERA